MSALACGGCRTNPPTTPGDFLWRSGDSFWSAVDTCVSRFAKGDDNAVGDLAEWQVLSDSERAEYLDDAIMKCWTISAERVRRIGSRLPRRYQEHLAMSLVCVIERKDVSNFARSWDIDERPLLEWRDLQ